MIGVPLLRAVLKSGGVDMTWLSVQYRGGEGSSSPSDADWPFYLLTTAILPTALGLTSVSHRARRSTRRYLRASYSRQDTRPAVRARRRLCRRPRGSHPHPSGPLSWTLPGSEK